MSAGKEKDPGSALRPGRSEAQFERALLVANDKADHARMWLVRELWRLREAGRSHNALAQDLGLSANMLSRMLNNEDYMPDIRIALRIATMLGMPLLELLDLPEESWVRPRAIRALAALGVGGDPAPTDDDAGATTNTPIHRREPTKKPRR